MVDTEARPLPLVLVVGETETEPFPDADETSDIDQVGDSEGCVEGDTDDDDQALCDALIEGTVVTDTFADREGPVETLPLIDGDGDAESEARAEEETLVDFETVTEAETAALCVLVSDIRLLCDGPRETLDDHDPQADADTLGDELPEALLEGEGRAEPE